MAFDQYFNQEWKSIPAASADCEMTSGCFDCNICLDFARDPVVTLCGHLYCWPCIYKWFQFQHSSVDSDEQQPQCPVCKAKISQASMVPLYGRGKTQSEVEPEGKARSLDITVPPRPPAFGTQVLMDSSSHLSHHNPHYFSQPYNNFMEGSSPALLEPGDNAATNGVFSPVVGMFGEMVYARIFGNSESLYAYPNSYHLAGSSSPRLRRQEMQADKSLSRISVFLFCGFLLCLLLF